MTQPTAHEQVRSLLDQMRKRVVYLTRKPIDPDIDNATILIETLTAGYMLPTTEAAWLGIRLTKVERRIIDLLSAQPGHVFSKEALMSAVYYDRANDEPEVKIIDVKICHLRKKLVKVDAPKWIETVWGLGWRLVDIPARQGATELQQALKYRGPYGTPSGAEARTSGHAVRLYDDDGDRN